MTHKMLEHVSTCAYSATGKKFCAQIPWPDIDDIIATMHPKNLGFVKRAILKKLYMKYGRDALAKNILKQMTAINTLKTDVAVMEIQATLFVDKIEFGKSYSQYYKIRKCKSRWFSSPTWGGWTWGFKHHKIFEVYGKSNGRGMGSWAIATDDEMSAKIGQAMKNLDLSKILNSAAEARKQISKHEKCK